MSTSDFLKLQLSLLVSQFGRKSVLDALAGLSGLSTEQIEAEIAAHEAKKRAKAPKRDKSLDEIMGSVVVNSDEAKKLLTQIGHLYETKQFLPNLRDAEEFLRRNSAPNRKFKSRKEALLPVLKALATIPRRELESLVAHATNADGQSDYALLANQLMGKGQ